MPEECSEDGKKVESSSLRPTNIHTTPTVTPEKLPPGDLGRIEERQLGATGFYGTGRVLNNCLTREMSQNSPIIDRSVRYSPSRHN